eukprot:jgi/Chlat1/2884/Chrsp2S00355
MSPAGGRPRWRKETTTTTQVPLFAATKWQAQAADVQKVSSTSTDAGAKTKAKGKLVQADLRRVVLQWKLQAIVNERLFTKEVQTIPSQFTTFQEYGQSFLPALREEIRAQLASGLQTIGKAPYRRIVIGKVDESTQPLHFGFALDNTEKSSVTEAELFKGSDVVLLSPVRVDTLQDLLSQRVDFCLALARRYTVDNGDVSLSATAFLSDSSSVYHLLTANKNTRVYLTYIASLTTALRAHDALTADVKLDSVLERDILCSEGLKKTNALQQPSAKAVMKTNIQALCTRISHPNMSATLSPSTSLETNVSVLCARSRLNLSQSDVVRRCALDRASDKRGVRLVQGPPGTGKTSTLVAMISALAGMSDTRALVCAPTNVAVQVVAMRFIEQLSGDGESDTTTHGLRLADVGLVGSEERIDAKGPLGSVYLPARAKRLKEALVVGWTKAVRDLLLLLEAPAKAYADHVKQSKSSSDAKLVQGALKQQAFFVREIRSRADTAFFVGTTFANELPHRASIINTDVQSELKKQGATSSSSKATNNDVVLLPEAMRVSIEGVLPFISTLIALPKTQLTKHFVHDWCMQAHQCKGSNATLWRRMQDAKVSLQAATAASSSSSSSSQLTAVSKQLLRLDKRSLEQLIASWVTVLFSTVGSAGGAVLAKHGGLFDTVLVDEAAQLVEAETAIVMVRPGVRRLWLVGDTKQLPATVISRLAESVINQVDVKDRGYGRSLFQRLQSNGLEPQLLDTQYRMHPAISAWPRAQFYDGRVVDGPNVKQNNNVNDPLLGPHGPYAVFDVGNSCEERNENGSSFNVVEVKGPLEIGLISPYQAQVSKLQAEVDALRPSWPYSAEGKPLFEVSVRTVDGFQGSERDIILFSAVRSNRHRQLGFVKDPRRLNVAITRGKRATWIVGNADTLRGDKTWKSLLDNASKRGVLVSVSEDAALKEARQRARKQHYIRAAQLQRMQAHKRNSS